MAGSVAATIQGEAGSNPAAQFAVAATIYNRMQAGSFPGGQNPYAIVNAPSQYVGSATPNSTAQQFAQAIQDGTLGQYGNVGNATFFQTAGSSTTLGRCSACPNIGGNSFSDAWGSPTANFQAPAYGGSSSGLDPSALANPSTATDPTATTIIPGQSGNPITQGSQALGQIGQFTGNWIVRGGIVVLGIVLIAAAAFHLAQEHAPAPIKSALK